MGLEVKTPYQHCPRAIGLSIGAFLLLCGALEANAAGTQASPRHSRETASLRPPSAPKKKNLDKLSMKIPEANASYLLSTRVQKEDDWSRDWLDDGTSLRWRTRVEAQQLRADRENQTGLLDAYERRNQTEEMKGLSQSALNDLSSIFMRSQLKRFKRLAKGISREIRNPLMMTFLVASTMTGKEVKLRAAKWITIRSRTHIQQKSANLSFDMDRLDTVLAYNGAQEESVTARISTRLSDRWTAGYDTANHGTWRVNYGINF
jgi:hypothetical protein